MALLNRIELDTLLLVYQTQSQAPNKSIILTFQKVFPQGVSAASQKASRYSAKSVLYDAEKLEQLTLNCLGTVECEKELRTLSQFPKVGFLFLLLTYQF